MSQVVLIDSLIAGGLILAVLFLAQWKVGLAALAGSVLSSVLAVATGADHLLLGHGMLGYSSVLVAIAMAALFLAAVGIGRDWGIAGRRTVDGLSGCARPLHLAFCGGHLAAPERGPLCAGTGAVPSGQLR